MTRLCAVLFAGWASGWAGCADEPVDESLGTLPADDFPDELRAPIDPQGGWYRGSAVWVYDLGAVEVRHTVEGEFAGGRVNPMYVFCGSVTPGADPASPPTCEAPMWTIGGGGLPILGGQYPIVDEAPGSDTYSPFWELVYVSAGGGYVENDAKSTETMFRRGGLSFHPSGRVVHCAMIETGVAPGRPDGSSGIMLVQLWYEKFLGECVLLEGGEHLAPGAGMPDFETDVVAVGDERIHSVPSVDAFFPEVRQWDRETPVPDNILVDTAVDDALGRYTPLVRVNEVRVPWDYAPQTFRDIDDVDDSIIELRSPQQFRDLPILVGAGR
jgi:hypothetical protein